MANLRSDVTVFYFVGIVFLLCTACLRVNVANARDADAQAVDFTVRLDWVPSPEYYGFFYAKSVGLYRDAGLNVEISHGTGAPAVAAELASGTFYAGTTTSDNVLKQVARDARFASVTPLIRFNPIVIASLHESKIINISDLRGKTIGVNKGASPYQQFLSVMKEYHISPTDYKEYPIGYGGAAQLKLREVDAILAYTTNVVLDLDLSGTAVREMFLDELDEHKINSFGLVLVIVDGAFLSTGKLPSSEKMTEFVNATIEGYRQGAKAPELAVDSLRNVMPEINSDKVRKAIIKIVSRNATTPYYLDKLDSWMRDKSITDAARRSAISLYPQRPPL